MDARQSDNIELGHLRDGYPSLASWISRDPDGEAFIFRKFYRLSARNILHLQSQLTDLEREIDNLDATARTSAGPDGSLSRQASMRWETLTELASKGSQLEKTRLEKAEELKIKIKEYRKGPEYLMEYWLIEHGR